MDVRFPLPNSLVFNTERDSLLSHPQYAEQGWVSIVERGPPTADELMRLLEIAHDRAADLPTARRQVP